MFEQLTQYNNAGLMILRLAVAVIFIYHAMPKLKKAKSMAQGMGTSSEMVFMLGLVELLAPIGLILGIYVKLSALLLGIIMIGAIWMKYMKWHVPFSAMDKTGWEFDLILLASNIVILVSY